MDLDPDPHGSGSRGKNVQIKTEKKARKLFIRIFFTNLFKLDPDPHLKSSWIQVLDPI